MPGASNITSVTLSGTDVVITGEVENPGRANVGLLHIWLAQPAPDPDGAGLAFDCVAGMPSPFKGGPFTVTVPTTRNSGVVGKFSKGPATASAIAVVDKAGGPEVFQWSQIITVM